MNDVPPKDRDIAMVFQSYALYPHMTVRENLAFALKLRGMAEARDRQARQPRRDDARNRRRSRSHAASSSRVASASASHSGARSCGSRRFFCSTSRCRISTRQLRVQMRREIARLHSELGATMIYVTHDQVEAMTLGDRIVVMNKGQSSRSIRRCACTIIRRITFVAGFIGSPAMNFIDGTVVSEAPLEFVASEEAFRMTIPPSLADEGAGDR